MAEGKRPGGLTALAVMSFVFGGLRLIEEVISFGIHSLGAEGFERERQLGHYHGPMPTEYAILSACGFVAAILLILAGVGLLGQKRVMGRVLASIYAAVSIAATLYELLAVDDWGIITLVLLPFPALMLFLVNLTFKDDLVN